MKRLLNGLSYLFLLCLATFCLILLIADSFSCVTDPSLYYWLFGACVLLWAAGSFRKGLLFGMPLSAALLFGAYRYYGADPLAQLNDLMDHIAGAFYTHVSQPGAVYPYAGGAESHSLVLLFLGFLLAAYGIAALTSRGARISLSLLGTLPFFAACLVVNGSVPALPAAGMLLFWFLLAVTGNSYQPDGTAGRSFLVCLLPVCLLLGGLLLFNRPENYQFNERDLELSRRFDRLNHYFDLLTGGGRESGAVTDPDDPAQTSAPRSRFHSSWDGEDDSMDLTEDYDLDHVNLPVLRIKTEVSGQIYLRTRSFGDYKGTGWLPAEELSAGSSLPFAAFAAAASPDGVKRELEVRTMMDLDDLCLPYFSAVSSGSDAHVAAEQQDSYRIAYTEYTGEIAQLRIPQEAQAAEAAYRSHAHSCYTQLPDATRTAALEICREVGLRADDPDVILRVAEYVQQSAEYDLQTGAYPSGDYALYFLQEAHRGYCIHYATAAAVLYRALGIPARVTEGFLVDARAGRNTDVRSGDAHAWVEIYRDGVGWLPVEVTTQAGYATLEPEPTPPPATPEPSEAPVESAPPEGGTGTEPSPSPSPEPSPETSPENSPAPTESPADITRSFHFPWKLLLIPLALLMLLPLWYWTLRAYWGTQVRNPDGRRAAIACWRYAGRVSRFGCEIPETIVCTAEKAAFSAHMIRKDELELCRSELKQMIDDLVSKLSPLQRFRFRFLHGLK